MDRAQKKRTSDRRYVWRDSDTGRLLDVVVADPAVRPKRVTVQQIRRAVRAVASEQPDRPPSDRQRRK
jgi:hypothetical protein